MRTNINVAFDRRSRVNLQLKNAELRIKRRIRVVTSVGILDERLTVMERNEVYVFRLLGKKLAYCFDVTICQDHNHRFHALPRVSTPHITRLFANLP